MYPGVKQLSIDVSRLKNSKLQNGIYGMPYVFESKILKSCLCVCTYVCKDRQETGNRYDLGATCWLGEMVGWRPSSPGHSLLYLSDFDLLHILLLQK